MALYTIGDLHLSLGSDKPMEVFGEGWSNYVERIREGFAELTAEDVTVLCGDLSWGMSLEESLQDLTFIHELPGKKILTKGNHDYWWNTAAKMQRFLTSMGWTLCKFCIITAFFMKTWHCAAQEAGFMSWRSPAATRRKCAIGRQDAWKPR